MKITSRLIAAVAFMALASGTAYAADQAMKMDCCQHCCDQGKGQPAQPGQHQK